MKYIKVSTAFIGYHRWKEAPKEVSFLANWHRHLFKVYCTIEVTQGREVEFFIAQRKIKNYIDECFNEKQFELSCEEIAENVVQFLKDCLGVSRKYIVEISEDGENAGIVEYNINDER